MIVEWDNGNWPKCGKHGLNKNDIEYVLRHDPMVLPDRHPVTYETRFNAVGQTENGRYAFIVFTIRNKNIRPIRARYMHRKEIENYVRQTRQ